MQNPMTWSLPLFRASGVLVKVHLLYFVVAVSLFLRTVVPKDNVVTWTDAFLLVVLLPFVSILAHEFGHIFGGRAVGGEGDEILMWPLGGLAFVDVPREWKAHTIMVACGPLVNLGVCVAAAAVLAGAGYLPNLNPISNPYLAEMKNYRDGRQYTSEYGYRAYHPGTADLAESGVDKPPALAERAAASAHERAVAPGWVVWVHRAFWMNWVLFLFNVLLPAYPMDAAQLLQGVVWWRTDYRTGLRVACGCGYVVGVLLLVAGFAANESLLVGLSLFCLFESWRRLFAMQQEGGEFGYDFSGGYSTLDGDDPPAKKPKKPGFVRRWLQARAARRLQREHEQRQLDDARVDELLDKINRKQPLTDEEQRFMKRVSERYKKQ